MNQEVKTQWLAALRSGNYKQGTMMLRSAGDEFCCLGVLCDLYNKANPEAEQQWELTDLRTIYTFDGDDGIPPEAVREWAGLKLPNPLIEVQSEDEKIAGSGFIAISDINDNGTSFADIANYIEAQL